MLTNCSWLTAGSPATQDGGEDEQRTGYVGKNGFQFLNSHSQPIRYGMQGQVPNFTVAGGSMYVSTPRFSSVRLSLLTALVHAAEFIVFFNGRRGNDT